MGCQQSTLRDEDTTPSARNWGTADDEVGALPNEHVNGRAADSPSGFIGKGFKRILGRATSHLSLDAGRPRTMAGRNQGLDDHTARPQTAFDASVALGNNFSRLRITSQSNIIPPFPLYAPSRGPTPNTSSTSMEWPIFQTGIGGGDAARAAAKAENNRLSLVVPMGAPSDPKAWDRERRDSMSAIGAQLGDGSSLDVESPKAEQAVCRSDPLSKLPLEIIQRIFPLLDAPSLAQAEQVSRAWNHAIDRLAWRAPFFRDWDRHSKHLGTDQVMKVGGNGVRRPNEQVDWKKLYFLRKEIESRWQDDRFLLNAPTATQSLSGHTDGVYCIQFDESKIITGSRDMSLRLWDKKSLVPCARVSHKVESLNANSNYPGHYTNDVYHTGSILCLQFDKDILVTGSSDKSCIVWDWNDRCRPIQQFTHHYKGVLDVRFNDRFILSSSKDMTLCLYDRKTFSLITRLTGHTKPVNAIQLRGNLAVSASGDGLVKLWNLDSALCIKEFAPERDGRLQGLACVEFSEDGRTIWAGGNEHIIYEFDAITGDLVRELIGHGALVRSLYLDNANKRLISGSYDTTVIVWNSETGDGIMQLAGLFQSWCLSAKADYRHLMATSQDGTAVVIDLGAGLEGVEELSSVKTTMTELGNPSWWDAIVNSHKPFPIASS